MRPRSVLFRLLLAAACLLVPACGILRKPDMSRTTGIAKLNRPEHPLILIHGFIGSKLRDAATHKVAWGTMTNVLRGGDNEDLSLPMDASESGAAGDRLEAYEIYKSLWGRDFYGEILRSLREAGGYRIGDIDDPKPGDNAFVFVYDWRRDNVETARRLADAIDRLGKALGRPGERFDLLTHSQGGLVARYFIMYGGRDVLMQDGAFLPSMAGAEHVNKVILLGTPNRGCLESLKILHVGVKKVFRPMRPEVVFTMPSVFQMLPPKGSVLFADVEGRPIELDLYDPRTWEREGWSAFAPEAQQRIRRRLDKDGGVNGLDDFNRRARAHLARQLDRADRFHRALDAPVPPGAEVAYYAFGSDCISTLKTAIIGQRRGRRELILDDEPFRGEATAQQARDVLYGPGDGTVLMQSLLAIPDGGRGGAAAPAGRGVSFKSAFFVCGSHGVLPNDPIFQNNLLYLLLWRGELPASAAAASTAGR